METSADVLIVGGGLGGVAAAIAASEAGLRVVMTEATGWLGGQLTSQAVPPDEHPWIERTGGSASYRELRRRIRRYYRANYPLSPTAIRDRHLNPGRAWVSPLAHEPRVALAVIDSMLQAARASGRLRVFTHTAPVEAHLIGERLAGVSFRDRSGQVLDITARAIVDATETGNLLPLARVEHVSGSESQSTTGEPHASPEARPSNMQATTVCLAVDHVPGSDNTIERPRTYAAWRSHREPYWPDQQLSWTAINPRTLEPVTYPFEPDATSAPADRSHVRGSAPGARDLWSYRRILARDTLRPGALAGDISILNWPQNDYLGGPLYGDTEADAGGHLAAAQELSRSLLYWLQTEAPRPDGGRGWPGLRPRGDITGTRDGLARQPYVRESRRIVAEVTVVEQDIAQAERPGSRATSYPDSVGTGYYRLDLHPSTGGDNFLDIPSLPYELPLGALIPRRVDGLIAGAKNIGTTHITNGCYRVHPTEWLIGEVAGRLAVAALSADVPVRAVRSDASRLARFQDDLAAAGVTLRWPSWVVAPRG